MVAWCSNAAAPRVVPASRCDTSPRGALHPPLGGEATRPDDLSRHTQFTALEFSQFHNRVARQRCSNCSTGLDSQPAHLSVLGFAQPTQALGAREFPTSSNAIGHGGCRGNGACECRTVHRPRPTPRTRRTVDTFMSPRRIVLGLIAVYRLLLSPWLGPCCRFEPTCSAYAEQAVETHGLMRGLWYALRRILRCRPGCPGGYDPVPPAPTPSSSRPA